MLTTTDVLEHLGYDQADEVIERKAARALETAQLTLRGAVGEDIEDFLLGDSRAESLVFMYIDDLWDERGTSAKVSGATRRLTHTLEWQLKLELQRKREAAEGVTGA